MCAKALLREGARIVFMGAHYDVELSYNKLRSEAAEDFATKQYGVDYVNLGFKPNYVAVILGLGESLQRVFTFDVKKQPTATIPALRGVKSYADLAWSWTSPGPGSPGSGSSSRTSATRSRSPPA